MAAFIPEAAIDINGVTSSCRPIADLYILGWQSEPILEKSLGNRSRMPLKTSTIDQGKHGINIPAPRGEVFRGIRSLRIA